MPEAATPTPFRLDNRIALITGAGSGIGEAIARRLAEAGATVWVADIADDGIQSTAEAIRQNGGVAEGIQCDVSSTASADATAQTVLERSGRLDILVNNAGIGHVGTILQTTADDLDRLHSVNVRGVFNLSKAFLPSMIERRHGVIINLASIGGLVGIEDRLAYCATKFAVVGITKSMALDHAQQGIRVNCICPGRVETPFVTARLQEYPDPEAARRQMTESQPLGRMGRPEEIGHAALYLASDEAAYVTGATFQIDGGWSAG